MLLSIVSSTSISRNIFSLCRRSFVLPGQYAIRNIHKILCSGSRETQKMVLIMYCSLHHTRLVRIDLVAVIYKIIIIVTINVHIDYKYVYLSPPNPLLDFVSTTVSYSCSLVHLRYEKNLTILNGSINEPVTILDCRFATLGSG